MANAYGPTVGLCEVVVGGGGTRYDCFGGESPSERSTLTYMSRESPRELSGSHASKRDGATVLFLEAEEDDDAGRSSWGVFCCSRAMYPGILSFADGVG